MRQQIRTIIRNLPSVPVYFYLGLLALLSTSAFILLLTLLG